MKKANIQNSNLIYKICDINYRKASLEKQDYIKRIYSELLYYIKDLEAKLIITYSKMPINDIEKNLVLPYKNDEFNGYRAEYNKIIKDCLKEYKYISDVKKEIYLVISGEAEFDINKINFYLKEANIFIEQVSSIENTANIGGIRYNLNFIYPELFENFISLFETIDIEQKSIEISLNPVIKQNYSILYNTFVDVELKDKSESNIKIAEKDLKNILRSLNITYHNNGLFNRKKRQLFTCKELEEKMPFSYSQPIDQGLVYGITKGKKVFKMDRKKLQTPNTLVLSDSEVETSLYCINEIEQVILTTDDDVVVIDTEGNYKNVAEKYNGRIITIKPGDGLFDNQLVELYDQDISDIHLSDKQEFIFSILEILVDVELSQDQILLLRPYIDDAIRMYLEVDNFRKENSKSILETLVELIKKTKMNELKGLATIIEENIIKCSVLTASKIKHDKNARVTVYDISQLAERDMILAELILLEMVYNQMIKNGYSHKYTWIYIDNIYPLYKTNGGLYRLEYLYKRSRLFYGLMTLCTSLDNILNKTQGTGILCSSYTIALMKQNNPNIHRLSELLNVNVHDVKHINDNFFLLISGSNKEILNPHVFYQNLTNC